MRSKNLLLVLLLFCLSCKNTKHGNEKFDKLKWATKTGKDYPYRDRILKDLMTNYQLKGVRKDSILSMLGPASRTDTNYLFYMVSQKRLGSWPISTKSLVIKFEGDSTVVWLKIHE